MKHYRHTILFEDGLSKSELAFKATTFELSPKDDQQNYSLLIKVQ